jgi:hypothetical protein
MNAIILPFPSEKAQEAAWRRLVVARYRHRAAMQREAADDLSIVAYRATLEELHAAEGWVRLMTPAS